MNLNDLLSNQKIKQTIKDLADKYNFTNIRLYFQDIYPYPSPGSLVLVVDSAREKENLRPDFMAELTRELQIDIEIRYSSEIHSKSLLENRAIPLDLPLEEIQLRIEKLSNIQKNLNQIEYRKANLEQPSLKRTLKMIDSKERKKHQAQNTFENEKSETNNSQNSNAVCFYGKEERPFKSSKDNSFGPTTANWQSRCDQLIKTIDADPKLWNEVEEYMKEKKKILLANSDLPNSLTT